MVQDTSVTINLVEKKEPEIFFWVMGVNILANLKIIKFMGMGCTPGPMIERMKEVERIISWMGMGCLNMQMG